MTENKLYKKYTIKYISLIIFGLIILCNTNNNPNAFVQRVLRPIKIGNVTIFYAALIALIIIYKGLKGFYICNKTKILRTRFRRIIVMIILVIIFANCWTFGLKTYKGFVGGLDSIYCNRGNLWLFAHKVNDNKVKLSTVINLQNCGFEDQEFYVKIKIPEEWKDYIIEEDVLAKGIQPKPNNKIYINKRESGNFRIETEIECKDITYTNMRTKDFDFILFNDKEKVVFNGVNSLY